MAKQRAKKDININDERAVRINRISELSDAGIEAFPSESNRTHSVSQALALAEGKSATIGGRIMMKRDMGKLAFCHIQDASGRMQIALKKGDINEDAFKLFVKKIDIGDIVQITGERFVTHKGEDSLLVKEWTLLTKSIRPLPDKFHGLQDEETKLRKRYLDLLTDPALKDVFVRKTRFWGSMREFLAEEGFLEVETPVLEATAGGADATPFSTHHNALDMDVFLRISMGELWQKRLMVAGFEKTFEIGRQFRNEGMSREHLQDYTQMEFYWAFANYRDGMDLVERMYKHVVQETYGTLAFDQIGEFKDVDLSGAWGEIDYRETILEHTKVDILEASDDDIRKALKKLKVVYEDHEGRGRLIDSLWKYCRKQIKGPVFLVNLPVEVSPLAKRQADNPALTERYQVIIAGSELGNGYSELNDPIDQAGRFEEQAALREAGDTEAQMHDHDFVEALEYGMPPTTGFGVSERLFSFLEDRSIRECVLFPLMKPDGHAENQIGRSRNTMAAHAVILTSDDHENWSRLNTAAHLSAAFAAREGRKLIHIEKTQSKDGVDIPMNIQHAILMKDAVSREDLLSLKTAAEGAGMLVTCFTKEMRDSTNDLKVKKAQGDKDLSDIGFLGVLVYGQKKEVEKLTEQYPLSA